MLTRSAGRKLAATSVVTGPCEEPNARRDVHADRRGIIIWPRLFSRRQVRGRSQLHLARGSRIGGVDTVRVMIYAC